MVVAQRRDNAGRLDKESVSNQMAEIPLAGRVSSFSRA